MRTTLTAVSALALLAMAAPASAADVYASTKDPVAASYSAPANWTGFYLGVNGGYGENASSRDTTVTGDASALATFLAGTPQTVTGTAGIPGADPTGFLFGGQIGYLYQPQGTNFVFGGEFAFDGSNITGDKTALSTSPNANFNGAVIPLVPTNVVMHQQLDWVGTLTGVAGLTLGNAMVYGKAGLAFGQVQESVAGPGFFTGTPLIGSRTATDTGWTAGLGIAYKFTQNWSFGLEGDYFDLGNHSVSTADNTFASVFGPGTPAIAYNTSHISEDFWTVKAALNYQVGGNLYQSLK